MKIRIIQPDSFAAKAALMVAQKIVSLQKESDRKVNLVLATGNTMVDFLDCLARQAVDWSEVRMFHLDEYKSLPTDSPYSFAYFLKKNLFSKIRIPERNIFYINGARPDLAGYMNTLEENGGADITILGIGMDGHLAFNEPPKYSDFSSRMQEVELNKITIESNFRDYPGIRDVPFAYTMGMADIFESKSVYLLANKGKKAEIIKRAIKGPVGPEVPATILQNHPQTTVILDCEAAGLLG